MKDGTENRRKRGAAAWLRVLAVCAAMGAGMLVSGCGMMEKPLQKYDAQYLDYFDTITSVTVYAEDEKQWKEYEAEIRDTLQRCHRLFDIYNDYEGMNNIKTVNDHAGMGPVEVDEDLIGLLQFSEELCDTTGGRMNVALGSVLNIWHDYRTSGMDDPDSAEIPDMTELKAAAEHTDIHQMELDEQNHTVFLPDPRMRLDVGAVAKGYTAQLLCDDLRARGVTSALISLGGNVQTIGSRGDGKPWRVGVQNPDIQSSTPYLHAVELENLALVTSGVYQRYYVVDDVRYHHIINPDTLMPWWEYQSVTILCKDGRAADALSTAVFNMELEEGMALIESLEDTEAFWVMPDGSEVSSSGFDQYIKD